MKDSTKEFLIFGASFGGKLAAALITGKKHVNMTTTSALNMQSHWDKAWELREKEKAIEEAIAKIPKEGAFLIPSGQFKDHNGTYIGGIWRFRSRVDVDVFLHQKIGEQDEVRRFGWEDIKDYYISGL